MERQFWNQTFRFLTQLLGLWLSWDLLSHLVAEILWFTEVGYLPVFLRRLETQVGIWVVVCLTSAGFSLGNLVLANRLKYKQSVLKTQSSVLRGQLQGKSDKGEGTREKTLTLRSLLEVFWHKTKVLELIA